MSFTSTEKPCMADPELWFKGDAKSEQKAKAICNACHFREICLETCLETEELGGAVRWGIFGGLNPTERIKLSTKRSMS